MVSGPWPRELEQHRCRMNGEAIILDPAARRQYWRDLRRTGVLYFLAWRDVGRAYKQTAIGVAWR